MLPDSSPVCGLRDLRKHRRIKINEMADILGVTPSSYGRYESGSRHLYLHQARRIAQVLGCTIDDLGIWRSNEQLWAQFGPPGPTPTPGPSSADDRPAEAPQEPATAPCEPSTSDHSSVARQALEGHTGEPHVPAGFDVDTAE